MFRSARSIVFGLAVAGAASLVAGLALDSRALTATSSVVLLGIVGYLMWAPGHGGPTPVLDSSTVEHRLPTLHGIEPQDVVAALLDGLPVSGGLASHLWLLDTTTSTLRLVAAAGTLRPTGEPRPIDTGVLGAALEGGTARLAPESAIRTPGGERTVWRYAVPVGTDTVRGVAAVDVTPEPDPEALNRLVAHLRPALETSLALHVSRHETAVAQGLLRTARELSRLVDPEVVVERLLARALEVSNAESGSVMLLDQDTGLLRIAASRGLPDDVVRDTALAQGEGIAGWVLSTGQSVVIEDLDERGARSRRNGVRSAVAVPIADEDGCLGVLNVGSRHFHARFSSTALSLLESIGALGAVALRGAQATAGSRTLYFDTLVALAVALETKDPYARGTTRRVLDLATALGTAMALDDDEVEALRVAAMLHDIGMSAAGDISAVGTRPLSTVEWGILKSHPVIAADVLGQTPALRAAVPIVYHHHEHYDGSGYVTGISGAQIPLGARVLAVADAFVAMTSERSYRHARTQAEAVSELKDKAGSQFDPFVVDALVDLVSRPDQAFCP